MKTLIQILTPSLLSAFLLSTVAITCSTPFVAKTQNATSESRSRYGTGKGYLGVIYTELPDGTIKIVDILSGSPAERSGFRYGDRIEKFNGAPLHGTDSLTGTVRSLPPGTRVSVEVIRLNGDREVIEVVLERSPEVYGHPATEPPARSGGGREAPPNWQDQWSVDQ